jgi:hypothetical protein
MSLDADVMLLTEVSADLDLSGYCFHRTDAEMPPGRAWATIGARRPLEPLPDPHPATAIATYEGWTVASTVLPWRGCTVDPWSEGRLADRTIQTVDQILPSLVGRRVLWGGDWNHALAGHAGQEYAGTIAGRTHLLETLEALELIAPTADLPHPIDGLLSIDHIAAPADMWASGSRHVALTADGRRLSDHDAYVVEVSS